jgi:hypothetical protein
MVTIETIGYVIIPALPEIVKTSTVFGHLVIMILVG